MTLTMRTKITCGFVILAVGMMLTDFYHLLRTPADTVSSASSHAQHAPRY